MIRPAGLTSAHRACWAVAFALLLAMRLLTPAGFMPAWSGAELKITVCDDAGARAEAVFHHAHHGKTDPAKHRQSCPYAAAAATPFLELPALALSLPPAPAPLLELGTYVLRVSPQRKIERPPSRAPPVLV